MTAPNPTATRRGFADAAIAALLFGVNGSVAKFALQGGLTSTELVQLRSIGAAVALMGFLAVARPRSLRVGARELAVLAVTGVIGIGMVQWLYFVALDRLPVGIALLLEFLAPVFVVVWVRVARRELVRPRMWLALGLCLAGLAAVAEIWDGLALDGLGVAAGVGAAVALATYYLSSERSLGQRDPLSLAAWTFTAAAVFWVIVQPPWTVRWERLGDATGLGQASSRTVPLWTLVLWVIVFGTVIGYAFVLRAVRHFGSARAGIVGMMEPVLAAAIAWWMLGERLSGPQIAGGLVVLGGIVLASTARR